jgi:hypothetical protein
VTRLNVKQFTKGRIGIETTDTKKVLRDIFVKHSASRRTARRNGTRSVLREIWVMVAAVELRMGRSRTAALMGMFLVTGSVGLGGCASQSATVGEAALRQPSPAPEQAVPERLAMADFQVVDCQLPPAVHRLGIELVYRGSIRQVRTTTRDCVIRGGDSVVANEAT